MLDASEFSCQVCFDLKSTHPSTGHSSLPILTTQVPALSFEQKYAVKPGYVALPFRKRVNEDDQLLYRRGLHSSLKPSFWNHHVDITLRTLGQLEL